MNHENKKVVISEEKIFGKSFMIIRQKYVPEYDKNIFEAYLKKENRL